MGEYFARHFVGAYQQVGDFEVINVNGRLQKNGGNVVSYFCTPQGEVVHAVVGPVSAEKLLEAARWAVNAYDQAREAGGKDADARKLIVEHAHLRQLGVEPDRYYRAVRAAWPAALEEFQAMRALRNYRRSSHDSRRQTADMLRPTLVAARRKAARGLPGERIHQILAAQPLAPLKEVYRELFEELADEEVNSVRGRVLSAARVLKEAREQERPVLFIFYRGQDESKEPDETTRQLLANLLYSRNVRALLRHFAVVLLPRDELSALSNLVDVPVYEMPAGSSPVFLLADSTGEKRVVFPRPPMPADLAAHMLPAVNELRFAQADVFAAEGRKASAKRLLRLVLRSGCDSATKERARQKLSAVTEQLTAVTTASETATR